MNHVPDPTQLISGEPAMSDIARNSAPNRSSYVRRLLWSPVELNKVYFLPLILGAPLILAIRERIQDAREAAGAAEDLPVLEVLRSSGAVLPLVMEHSPRIFLPFLAVVWAGIVWKAHPFGKRDYTWSLPVDRPSHDLWRVVAGAVHLLIVILVVAAVGVVFSIMEGIPLFPDGSWPFWLAFFGFPLALYLAASIPVVASPHAGIWILGALAFMPVLGLAADLLDSSTLEGILRSVFTGDAPGSDSMALYPTVTYGRASGTVAWIRAFAETHAVSEVQLSMGPGFRLVATPSELRDFTSHSTWLLACALWMTPILGGIWLAARRRI